MKDSPQPAFERYERVVVVNDSERMSEFAGERGTVIWRDLVPERRSCGREARWIYIVDFDARSRCVTCGESELKSTGEMSSKADCLGKRCEISFDVLLEDDCGFIEGSYRLPGRFWEVLIISKRAVPKLRYQCSTWSSGITGIVVEIP